MVPKLFNEAGIGNHTAWDESGTVVNRGGSRERRETHTTRIELHRNHRILESISQQVMNDVMRGRSTHFESFANISRVHRERDQHNAPEYPQGAWNGQLVISRLQEAVAVGLGDIGRDGGVGVFCRGLEANGFVLFLCRRHADESEYDLAVQSATLADKKESCGQQQR